MSAEKPADENVHLIVVQDEEVIVEHHPEDWIASRSSGARVHRLPQFFTRYVLNDSLS